MTVYQTYEGIQLLKIGPDYIVVEDLKVLGLNPFHLSYTRIGTARNNEGILTYKCENKRHFDHFLSLEHNEVTVTEIDPGFKWDEPSQKRRNSK